MSLFCQKQSRCSIRYGFYSAIFLAVLLQPVVKAGDTDNRSNQNSSAPSEANESQSDSHQAIHRFFKQRLDYVFQQLSTYPERYKNAQALKSLAEQKIVDFWDLDATLLALIGRTDWQQLSQKEKSDLRHSLRNTLVRYFMEAHEHYSGQPVVLEDVQLNHAMNKGWLTLRIALEYMPDLKVDFNIVKVDNQWLFRDLRFQGIRYTRMKRGFYQKMLKQLGAKQLAQQLSSKNTQYFESRGIQSVPTSQALKH